MDNILEVRDLYVNYETEDVTSKAINGISFNLKYGESLGLVGETGAGKTTTALSIMQLIPNPPGKIIGGEINFKGKNLIYNTAKENQEIRGNGISMIFQDPMTALNPIMTIGNQLQEVVLNHKNITKEEAKKVVIEMLEVVGVKGDRYDDYPHQFSGGMKQRVVITMALLCNPELLIADEPTTALDVTIQAQVLDIIQKLREKLNMSMILITHDLGVVAETCDRVMIMYAGQIVESGTIEEVFLNPKHPYTRGLFDSIPKLDADSDKLIPIEGEIQNASNLPTGCYFHPRCKYRKDICHNTEPKVKGQGHQYKCHFQV